MLPHQTNELSPLAHSNEKMILGISGPATHSPNEVLQVLRSYPRSRGSRNARSNSLASTRSGGEGDGQTGSAISTIRHGAGKRQVMPLPVHMSPTPAACGLPLFPSGRSFEPPCQSFVAGSDFAHFPPCVRVFHGLGLGQNLFGARAQVARKQ
jgi:hypothetical protein